MSASDNIRNSLKMAPPDFAAEWFRICDESEAKKAAWIADLRERGFKASHPNDGWVNRELLQVTFMYPDFNDSAGIGDLVMIGSHYDKATRPVRLVERVEMWGGTERWVFEDVAM